MPLTPGTRLGVFELTELIGRGGMGEVYRARDTKLDRDVAIKVLPEAFVADPERVGRFLREANTLASLNHPNIIRASVTRKHTIGPKKAGRSGRRDEAARSR